MTTFIAPLVGMHFRPPAKAILAVLPADCPLTLIPEPDNPHDPNAVQVIVESADIPEAMHSELDTLATGFGYPIEAILDAARWHLGYVAASTGHAALLSPMLSGETPAKLRFSADGKPQIETEI